MNMHEETVSRRIIRFLLVLAAAVFLMTAAAQASTVKTGSGHWEKKNKHYVYVLENGSLARGWFRIGKSTYYFSRKGYRATGWTRIHRKYYYFSPRGRLKTGWICIKGKTYYLDPKCGGARASGSVLRGNTVYFFSKSGVYKYKILNDTSDSFSSGWTKIGDDTFYFGKNGYCVTGWNTIHNRYYFFNSHGRLLTGWQKISGRIYYLDPARRGMRVRGLQKIDGKIYYFNKKGVMQTGVVKINGKLYFFNAKTGERMTGWIYYKSYTFYANERTAILYTGKRKIGNKYYYFSETGALLHIQSKEKKTWTGSDGKRLYSSTLKKFLKTALEPVGSTLYVYGGGWTFSGTSRGSDITTRTVGVNPRWRAFYERQDADYDYKTTRLQTKNGLDCVGYVAWVIYNTFNIKNGNAGYVMEARFMAATLSSYGWGSYTLSSHVKNFRPGDVMSSSDHVYIVVGSCSDGSIVLLHSSPNGVMLTGTETPSGSENSKAIRLARRYMKRYFPEWIKRYPDVSRDNLYLTQFNQMRWYLGETSIMSDPDGYRNMTAGQILADLFSTW